MEKESLGKQEEPNEKDLHCKEEMNKKKNPRVFLELSMGGSPPGRLIIELYAYVVSKTAENFRALCTGEKGIGARGKPLHYKGTTFHSIHPGAFAEVCDFVREEGPRCGESIYGGLFEAENFEVKHNERGIVSMARTVYNKIGSKFYIIFEPHSYLDGEGVAFGKVEGLETLDKMEKYATFIGEPFGPVEIIKCGQLKDYVLEETNKGKMERSEKRIGSIIDDGRNTRRKYSSSNVGLECYSSKSDIDLHLEPDCNS